LAAKSSAYADFVAAADMVLAIAKESKMHVAFSAQWGVDLAELECTPESPACTAYGAYIMNVGLQGMISHSFYEETFDFILFL
jgi:hydroxymethylpyrimidine/phosphomethylpyrimidine kinase / thiaminase